MLRFYNLLITVGHWPLNTVHVPPHEHPPLYPDATKELNFSTSAIEVITAIPHPNEQVVYHSDCNILEVTHLLDLTDTVDLKESQVS
jgi:hypothetical protein